MRSLFLLALLFPSTCLAADIPAFVKQFCVDCHGAKKAEGELRLDTEALNYESAESRQIWEGVLERLEAGEMPPKEVKNRPTDAVAQAIRADLRTGISAAIAKERRLNGRAMIRRMNRVEYQNTIRDLLAVEAEVMELLPEDPIASGFDNIDAALRMSAVQLEQYLAAAEVALDAALGPGGKPIGPKPEAKTRRLIYKDTQGMKNAIKGGSFVAETPDAAVLFHNGYTPYDPRELWQTPPGRYKIRISAYGYQTAGKPAVMAVYFGNFIPNAGKSHLVGYFDVPADKPKVIEFEDRFVATHDTLKPVPYGGGNPWKNDGSIQSHKGPGLAVQWIEIEGPLHEAWPPAAYQRLLGEADPAKGTSDDAEKLLRAFLPKAFRRAVTDAEMQKYVALARQKLEAGRPFLQAMRFAYATILCSPSFLYVAATNEATDAAPLDGPSLASRLSYFLWNSQPDEELTSLAASGSLQKPEILKAQVERMLKDPKATRFTENFTGQWLGLRQIDFTTPDPQLYPEFDEFLKWSMVHETHAFFEEILAKDLSVANFVDSDWGMLNGRLATHYGLNLDESKVSPTAMTRVALPADSHRGGVLTQAAILKVTANGTSTSPVVRGAWVLDRILGTPAPPPPANVPAVEPDIRGATTIREQLAKHRTDAVCASCHRKMDPPGFALESFDVIGGWRQEYRALTNWQDRQQKRMKVTLPSGGDRMMGFGRAVDPSDEFESGEKFANVEEMKQILLRDRDRLAAALARRLIVYATGHAIEPIDGPLVAEIVARAKAKDYGFRTLIHEVVASEAFRRK